MSSLKVNQLYVGDVAKLRRGFDSSVGCWRSQTIINLIFIKALIKATSKLNNFLSKVNTIITAKAKAEITQQKTTQPLLRRVYRRILSDTYCTLDCDDGYEWEYRPDANTMQHRHSSNRSLNPKQSNIRLTASGQNQLELIEKLPQMPEPL